MLKLFCFSSKLTHLLQQCLGRGLADEGPDVHIDEGGHQVLAVEAVHHAAVPGDHVAEVLLEKNNNK